MTMSDLQTHADPVYALAASPHYATDGLCFAARNSGLLRSVDGGHTWRNAYAALELQAPLTTTCVACSPNFDEDRTVFAGAPGGILRATDGGEEWRVSTLPTPPPFLTALALSPAYRRDGLVFVATMEDGVLRSWDRGDSWAGWNFGLLDLSVYALVCSPAFAEDETLLAGVESGLFISTNGGRAWRETAFPMESGPVLSVALSSAYPADRTIFAGTETAGLLRSVDNGATWTQLLDEGHGPFNELTVDADGALWAIAGDAVLRTAYDSQSWSTLITSTELGAAPSCLALVGGDEPSAALVGSQTGRVEHIKLG